MLLYNYGGDLYPTKELAIECAIGEIYAVNLPDNVPMSGVVDGATEPDLSITSEIPVCMCIPRGASITYTTALFNGYRCTSPRCINASL